MPFGLHRCLPTCPSYEPRYSVSVRQATILLLLLLSHTSRCETCKSLYGFAGNYAPSGLSPQTNGMPVIQTNGACSYTSTIILPYIKPKCLNNLLTYIKFISSLLLRGAYSSYPKASVKGQRSKSEDFRNEVFRPKECPSVPGSKP